MTKIEQFDKSNLTNISNEMQAALEAVGAKYGITFKRGGISYSASNFTVKVEAILEGAKPIKNSKEEAMLEIALRQYNLNKVSNCGEYTLVGFKTNAPKMPFIYQAKDGSRYKCSEQSAKFKFGK